MMPETQEWINKAEGDWKVAGREMGDDDPVFDKEGKRKKPFWSDMTTSGRVLLGGW